MAAKNIKMLELSHEVHKLIILKLFTPVQQTGKARMPLLVFQPLKGSTHLLEEIHLVSVPKKKKVNDILDFTGLECPWTLIYLIIKNIRTPHPIASAGS